MDGLIVLSFGTSNSSRALGAILLVAGLLPWFALRSIIARERQRDGLGREERK